MNMKHMRILEQRFLSLYPKGFDSPEMKEAGKKHKVDKMEQMAKEVLSKESLNQVGAINGIVKLITRSSLVSLFEKTRFRNLINEADDLFKQDIVDAVYTMIHENQAQGFDRLVSLLAPYKMAKWPILSVLLFYLDGEYEVLVKPTTVKKVLSYLECTDITYSPKASFAFYQKYRDMINIVKAQCDPRLSRNNGAFQAVFMLLLE
ncbi:hypothetical protein [Candidatus Xianfuyuplasma coldseepsis]|uniref:Uncharacterized protein n=1 Tax=Candidatus Xianfuyuplasma coldseepsis TaxID=2782163 RepID=A0A7L7KPY7_9MOLU|nr:hypothetical protein [Xianfuyuplasma coldseepsis]QMS84499.1 hypothetical protein G4Z02_01630 [Xianfuyuplasma coldseepsis]